MHDMIITLNQIIAKAKEEKPTRELSIAITNLETGKMWLTKAYFNSLTTDNND